MTRAKCHTFATRPQTPTFGDAPKSRKTNRLDCGPRLGLPLSHASHRSQKGLFATATTATRALLWQCYYDR